MARKLTKRANDQPRLTMLEEPPDGVVSAVFERLVTLAMA
ncbi:hypothetical protein COLO4_29803 [Corchorus olitorius]|uniref:Uncharacterized protein n=1 Tax=Corchorus olitorius TaxID=93759 RepID=A0A1R3HD42_9ROSI|nr:hypothetical protein COLO4_29803 [Corchorus olitorius]